MRRSSLLALLFNFVPYPLFNSRPVVLNISGALNRVCFDRLTEGIEEVPANQKSTSSVLVGI